MAGTLKIGGNTIATHAGSEGAGTVTLDSSALTIGSNTTVNSTISSSAAFPTGHVLQTLYDDVKTYGKGKEAECILAISEGQYQDVNVVDKEINFMSTIIKLKRILK